MAEWYRITQVPVVGEDHDPPAVENYPTTDVAPGRVYEIRGKGPKPVEEWEPGDVVTLNSFIGPLAIHSIATDPPAPPE